MPIHIPRMWKMAGKWQEKPCIRGFISWPSCRLASYLLNETVLTVLDNRTLASAPQSLLLGFCCITEIPCARAQIALERSVGGFLEPHNRQLQMLPLLLLECSCFFFLKVPSYHRCEVTQDYEWYTQESRFNSQSHISPEWMCGCDSNSCWLIPSQSTLLLYD